MHPSRHVFENDQAGRIVIEFYRHSTLPGKPAVAPVRYPEISAIHSRPSDPSSASASSTIFRTYRFRTWVAVSRSSALVDGSPVSDLAVESRCAPSTSRKDAGTYWAGTTHDRNPAPTPT